MADTRQPPSASAWAEFCRAAASMLPFGRAEEIAVPLAGLWLRTSNAQSAILVFRASQGGTPVAACADVDGRAMLLAVNDARPPTGTSPSTESSIDFSAEVARLAALHSRVPRDATTVPLAAKFGALGAVSVAPFENQPLEMGLLPELVQWTVGLIAQANLTSIPPVTGTNSHAAFPQLETAKVASLAEFAAGAGHEINNPLATISGRVQLLLRDETDPERRRALATIGGQAYRIRDMIGDLMVFSDPPAPQLQSTPLQDVIESVASSMANSFDAAGCSLTVDAEENPAIWADRRQLEIVIDCLLRNSLKASPPGGVIRIAAQWAGDTGESMAQFTVTDSGEGIDEAARGHLFDPFFSGRQAGRGLGFGLSKCWRIVTNHGGRISVTSVPGGETTFEVSWPAAGRSR